ncbi:cysteine-rich CWC family protein [Pseudomonas sp. GOM6]|uniref:cysteine-rich CWC family protein n=1 Tax=Pseudomonas sp. GOM6 TaxID=3036944 RepID=UPI002408FC2C|nr:cysteine-rich CWC family protein [Pseudomonas sp. GOM6]MDG1583324.1 cysteine-rich CWC family protein [Pseudomonas sp. GOM6]
MNDAERCPRCGQLNQCAQASSPQPVQDCWCFHRPIPRQLIEELPAEQRGKSCLCPHCAKALGTAVKTD